MKKLRELNEGERMIASLIMRFADTGQTVQNKGGGRTIEVYRYRGDRAAVTVKSGNRHVAFGFIGRGT